jgi:DnaJ-class molecular chaperone
MRSVHQDLYAALGVGRDASSAELRAAIKRLRASLHPSSPEYLQAAQAYAILGDPRLRAEYDAGRVVGTGTGQYFQSGVAGRGARLAGPQKGRLQARFERRLSVAGGVGATHMRPPRRTRWPFVFIAGNASGFFLTVIGIRLALGHPIS